MRRNKTVVAIAKRISHPEGLAAAGITTPVIAPIFNPTSNGDEEGSMPIECSTPNISVPGKCSSKYMKLSLFDV